MAIPQIRAGKGVYLEWTITKGDVPILTDPSPSPTISAADPTGTTQLSAATMLKTDPDGNTLPVGVWGYTYTTPSGGALGIWTAWVDAGISGSLKVGSFQLVAA
jgi:hypothetical protein